MTTTMMRNPCEHIERAPRPEPGSGPVPVHRLACGTHGSYLHTVQSVKVTLKPGSHHALRTYH